MRKRNRIHRKAVLKTQNPYHWGKYRKLRNEVFAEIRASRDRFNKNLSDQIDTPYPLVNGGKLLNPCLTKIIKNKSSALLKSLNHIFFILLKKLTCSTSILLMYQLVIMN